MRKEETDEHKKLKKLMSNKLNEWFGVTIDEYQSSGHELDVFSVTLKGLTLMLEIIWTPSRTNFYRDLSMLQSSDAQVKILVVNPKIMESCDMQRVFQKIRISEIRNGRTVSQMIDGGKILVDDLYLNYDVKKMISDLVNESKVSLEMEIEELKKAVLSDNNSLSSIIGRYLDLAKKLNLDHDITKWLHNELYGYDMYYQDSKMKELDDDSVSNLPGNPEYRRIKGKIRILFKSMDMRETEYKEFEYRMFFTNPISKLELLTNSSGGKGDVILSMNVDNLPENKSKALKNVNPSIQTIPVSITQYDLKNCIDQLRLRLHEFLNSIQ